MGNKKERRCAALYARIEHYSDARHRSGVLGNGSEREVLHSASTAGEVNEVLRLTAGAIAQ
jgi:hypothetical protein